jgi:hypothetical protein
LMMRREINDHNVVELLLNRATVDTVGLVAGILDPGGPASGFHCGIFGSIRARFSGNANARRSPKAAGMFAFMLLLWHMSLVFINIDSAWGTVHYYRRMGGRAFYLLLAIVLVAALVCFMGWKLFHS